MIFKIKKTYLFFLLPFILIKGFCANISADKEEKSKLLQSSQNPVADLISLPFQNNFNLRAGPDHELYYVLNIEPIIPIKLPQNYLLATRTIFPIISLPYPKKKFGVGDVTSEFFFVPPIHKHFGYGIGPAFVIPTASDELLGNEQFCIGPNIAFVYVKKSFLLGAIFNNLWSILGNKDRPSTNTMTLEPFAYYTLNHEWYVYSAPIMYAYWKAKQHSDIWLIPVGGGFGTLLHINGQFINLAVSGYYYVARPKNFPSWTFRVTFHFLFPK